MSGFLKAACLVLFIAAAAGVGIYIMDIPSAGSARAQETAMSRYGSGNGNVAPAPVPSQENSTKKDSVPLTAVQPDDRVLGNPDAPVTIIEYASLTCSHCAAFHRDVLPRLKNEYIATGKVRFVFRDFPFDQYALNAAILARCADQTRYFGLLDLLFRNQEKWAMADDPLKALQQLGALAGVSPQQYDQCLSDKALEKQIAQMRLDAETGLKVDSTPTLFIQGTERISGTRPYETYTAAIDRALKKR
ncbi:MAG: DsbA family protein [Pseudomonadota bacterium]|nr:DsbA family protein [Pseudomonadota bacterium]